MSSKYGYGIKVSLDKEGRETMIKAVKHLNGGKVLFFSDPHFITTSIKFYCEAVINSEELGIAFTPIKKWERFGSNSKKTYWTSNSVYLDKELIEKIKQSINCLHDYKFFGKINISTFTRMSVMYFSKYALNNELGLAFRPRSLK